MTRQIGCNLFCSSFLFAFLLAYFSDAKLCPVSLVSEAKSKSRQEVTAKIKKHTQVDSFVCVQWARRAELEVCPNWTSFASFSFSTFWPNSCGEKVRPKVKAEAQKAEPNPQTKRP